MHESTLWFFSCALLVSTSFTSLHAMQEAKENITIEDIKSVLDLNAIFSEHKIEYSPDEMTLYFWGIKK